MEELDPGTNSQITEPLTVVNLGLLALLFPPGM